MNIADIEHIADSNICIHLLSGWKPAKQWWEQHAARTALTDVVAMELIRGTASPKKLHTVEAFLSTLPILKTRRQHFQAAELCYRTWDRRKSQRTPALPDMMIAQVAIAHALPLVSFNKKDFEHVPGLQLLPEAYENTGG